MGLELLLPGGVVSMSGDAAERLLRAGNGDAALLYLALAARREASALHWDARRLGAAAQVLEELRLARAQDVSGAPEEKPEPTAPPEYTGEEMTRQVADDATFAALLAEMQRRLGTVFYTADLRALCTMYNYLALPAEVILLLTTWCVEETERALGPLRRPRMSQVQREAFVWHRRGIVTAEQAEAYLRDRALLRDRGAQILELVGVRGRAPVAAERKYLDAWAQMGFDDETLRLAYEKTVLKKQEMNWAYMGSILRSWHAKGLHSVAEVRARDSAWRKSQAGARAAAVPAGDAPAGDDKAWMDRFVAQLGEEDAR